MKHKIAAALAFVVSACSGGATPTVGPDGECSYPVASEPMSVGNALSPYKWPSALDGQRVMRDLDLAQVHCDTDPDMDWSPFDLLVFVSIPAW